MLAFEFHAYINEDGTITIPEPYRSQLHGTVRVIILTEQPASKPSIIRQLLANPRRVEDATPFKRDELYNRSL
ncbi:MAG: hypothetical protein OHK0022_36360 [Roseiflexaceae bacterium]